MITAKILADSVNSVGNRLTTFELIYPRIVHAELLTHRELSRGTSSSRAIPNARLVEKIRMSPFVPSEWGSNQKGMQAGVPLPPDVAAMNEADWLEARDLMLEFSQRLAARGVHKQLANRLLEPFMHVTVIVSATNYSNWFYLRNSGKAQPEIKDLAKVMWQAYKASTPRRLNVGDWHRPLFDGVTKLEIENLGGEEESGIVGLYEDIANKVSVGRCARVSYENHNGVRDVLEDIRLHDDLVRDGHWSPTEHVAQALPGPYRSGNFIGWHQYRKQFPNEYVSTYSDPYAIEEAA